MDSINRIDLNLFAVFDAIVREGSISAAARRLNLSQPAVSHALARLRSQLDDPLFVRRGRQMVATPRAQQLISPVRDALSTLGRCLTSAPAFEPALARRSFVLGLRDGLEACLLPPLIAHLQQAAPGVTLQSLTIARRDTQRELAAGRIDLAVDVLLPGAVELHQQRLLEDGLTVLLRRAHPLAQQRLTLNRYLAAQHVLVSSRRRGPALEDAGLAELGKQRQIALRCQHYQSALEVVASSDLLLTLPTLLAGRLADQRFLALSLPLPAPPMALYLYWHPDRDDDEAHGWLRQLLLDGRADRAAPVHS